jgi:hypothetical protein
MTLIFSGFTPTILLRWSPPSLNSRPTRAHTLPHEGHILPHVGKHSRLIPGPSRQGDWNRWSPPTHFSPTRADTLPHEINTLSNESHILTYEDRRSRLSHRLVSEIEIEARSDNSPSTPAYRVLLITAVSPQSLRILIGFSHNHALMMHHNRVWQWFAGTSHSLGGPAPGTPLRTMYLRKRGGPHTSWDSGGFERERERDD